MRRDVLTCPFRKLYPRIAMVKSAEHSISDDDAAALDWPTIWSILVNSEMSPRCVVICGVCISIMIRFSFLLRIRFSEGTGATNKRSLSRGGHDRGRALHSVHSRHRGATAVRGPLIGRASLDVRSVNSSILERNSLRIGEVFDLL